MLGVVLVVFAGAFYLFAVQPARGRLQTLALERAELATAAQRNGLSLDKGEYRLGQDKEFRLAQYQVTFPVRGTYAQVRGFVNAVLDAVPAAALDEITLKREAIGEQNLEARVRFTLYLGVE